MTETATATNPIEATPSTEAPAATLLAAATSDAGTTQQTQTTQTPAAETTETQEPAAQKTEETPAPVVPEKYEFKAPEGTEFDPAILESYSGAAKEAGLTQDAAQKLIEKMAPALASRQAAQITAIQEEWKAAAIADKEFGGAKLQENLGVVRKATDTFPSGVALRALLEQTGLGSHPDVLRYLYHVGKAVSADTFVGGSSAGTGKLNPSAVLYDKTPQKG